MLTSHGNDRQRNERDLTKELLNPSCATFLVWTWHSIILLTGSILECEYTSRSGWLNMDGIIDNRNTTWWMCPHQVTKEEIWVENAKENVKSFDFIQKVQIQALYFCLIEIPEQLHYLHLIFSFLLHKSDLFHLPNHCSFPSTLCLNFRNSARVPLPNSS